MGLQIITHLIVSICIYHVQINLNIICLNQLITAGNSIRFKWVNLTSLPPPTVERNERDVKDVIDAKDSAA